jgi:hypothetical protein
MVFPMLMIDRNIKQTHAERKKGYGPVQTTIEAF